MFHRFASTTLLLVAATGLHGANVVTTTGTSPFGFSGQPAFVIGWNQAISYTGVTITMPLLDSTPTPLTGVEGTVYLVNQIGPGTTSANQVAAPVQISGLTGAYTTVTLFSGLSLPAGNYYLVLVPTNTNPMSASPEGSSGANVTNTTGTSVTSLGAGVPTTLAGYPPASSTTLNTPGNIFFSATGTAGLPSTPAPSTLSLLLVGMLCAGLWMARRKFAS
jgi:hypothetical protein